MYTTAVWVEKEKKWIRKNKKKQFRIEIKVLKKKELRNIREKNTETWKTL